MFDGGIVINLYSGDYFDKVVVLFNSRIFVWEFSDRIYVLIVYDKFLSLQVLFFYFSLLSFLFFFFFFKRVYSLCLWYLRWCSCPCMCINTFCFCFSFIIFLIILIMF